MINLKKKLLTKPIFLYLLPVFFVLNGFTEQYDLIPAMDALLLTGIYTTTSMIIFFLAWLFFKNKVKASLLAFSCMGYNFFFGTAKDFLRIHLPELFSRYSVILIVSLLFFIILIRTLRKRRDSLTRITSYLNAVLCIFILFDTAMLAKKIINLKYNSIEIQETFTVCNSCATPDIYLIVADSYPGYTELKDICNFENKFFETELKNRGFHIIDDSRSNYNYTQYSIASMLSMEYLDGIDKNKNNPKGLSICYKKIKKNNVLGFLMSSNYDFYNYSIFEIDRQPSVTDQPLLLRKTRPITTQTFTSRIWQNLAYHLATDLKLKSFTHKLKTHDLNSNILIYELTKKIASTTSKNPKFVYSHLMMPHYPYYFDSNGNRVPDEELKEENWTDKNAFIAYLQYANKKIISLVDYIKKQPGKDPIIILMGDHGYREVKEKIAEKYHFMNLNSIYLPNRNYSPFYKGMSNVNEFRVLFNSQFGQRKGVLKDSTSFLDEY